MRTLYRFMDQMFNHAWLISILKKQQQQSKKQNKKLNKSQKKEKKTKLATDNEYLKLLVFQINIKTITT